MEVDVVSDAVGGELGCHVLEVGFAAALAGDIGLGNLGVHAQQDGAVGELVGEGLDVEKGGKEFQGIDVMLLGGGPIVLGMGGGLDSVQDTARGEVGGVHVQGDGG